MSHFKIILITLLVAGVGVGAYSCFTNPSSDEPIFIEPAIPGDKVEWKNHRKQLNNITLKFDLPNLPSTVGWSIDRIALDSGTDVLILYNRDIENAMRALLNQNYDLDRVPLYSLISKLQSNNRLPEPEASYTITSFMLLQTKNTSSQSFFDLIQVFDKYGTKTVLTETGNTGPYYFEKESLKALPEYIKNNFGIPSWHPNSPYSYKKHVLNASDPQTQESFSVSRWELYPQSSDDYISATIVNADYLASAKGGALLPVYNRVLNSLRFHTDSMQK